MITAIGHSMQDNTSILGIVTSIKSVLTEDLLKKEYRGFSKYNPTFGHCYAASEALYYLLLERGIDGYKPKRAKDSNGIVHWWLEDKEGSILDPTEEQYTIRGREPPYECGRFGGFLTKYPSKHAETIINRVKSLEEYVCPECGLRWVTKGWPSAEGTQMCLKRCYCGVDFDWL